jgi:hypothetical protein
MQKRARDNNMKRKMVTKWFIIEWVIIIAIVVGLVIAFMIHVKKVGDDTAADLINEMYREDVPRGYMTREEVDELARKMGVSTPTPTPIEEYTYTCSIYIDGTFYTEEIIGSEYGIEDMRKVFEEENLTFVSDFDLTDYDGAFDGFRGQLYSDSDYPYVLIIAEEPIGSDIIVEGFMLTEAFYRENVMGTDLDVWGLEAGTVSIPVEPTTYVWTVKSYFDDVFQDEVILDIQEEFSEHLVVETFENSGYYGVSYVTKKAGITYFTAFYDEVPYSVQVETSGNEVNIGVYYWSDHAIGGA